MAVYSLCIATLKNSRVQYQSFNWLCQGPALNISCFVCSVKYSGDLSRTRTSFCSDRDSVTRQDGAEPTKKTKVTVGRLYSMIRPDWMYGLCGTICAFIAGSQMPLFALGVSHSLVSYYEKDWVDTQKEVKKIAILFCCASAITLIVYTIEHICFGTMGERLTLRVREKMFSGSSQTLLKVLCNFFF